MPSFDIVSEVDLHELLNAVDQANREIGNRFDFKGEDAKVELNETTITLHASGDFKIRQMHPMLFQRLSARKIESSCLDMGNIQPSGKGAKQVCTVRQGIEKELARKMVKMIKDSKLKVQAAIQGDKIRVTAKKRDELQQVIALFRGSDLDMPLQYQNFRD
jgi:uncharacterized protein YajQ (UPF0234 family)